MAKANHTKLSEREMHTSSGKKFMMNSTKSTNKNSKKPMKSNITNKVKSRHVVAEDGQSDDEEGDSSAIEEHDVSTEEPDVFALSGAQQQAFSVAAKGLTGHKYGGSDDVSMVDATQAVAGAYMEDGVSDDEDYADVENVSESDESDDEVNERSVLRAAEEDLIDEFERTEQRRNASDMTLDMNSMALQEDEALARRLSLQDSDNQVDDFSFMLNMDEDPFYGFSQTDNVYNDMWNEAESALWRMPDPTLSRENSDPSSTTQKRVRFEEFQSRESSRSESEDPNEAFPDLFTASDDPMVQQRIALGLEHDSAFQQNDFNDTESFYDFEDEDEKLAFKVDEESDSDEDPSSSDSDDDGDTTDDETREEQIAKMHERKNAIVTAPNSTPSTPLPPKRVINTVNRTPSTRPTTPRDCKGPKAGTFAIDPTRATMTTDAEGRTIKMLPPTKPVEKDKAFWDRARTANSSRNNSRRNSYLTMPSPGADSIPPRPFTAQSTLGSMFNGNLDILRNNDIAGIAEDMFPAAMVASQSSFTTITGTDDSDSDHADINMQDFLDLNESDSDSDGPPTGTITSPTETDMYSSFTSDSGGIQRSAPDLLDHFDHCRGAIGSFRRNQHHAKHVSSLPSHPAKRASTHEYNALQKGRRGAANTPMTPARKNRVSQDLTPTGAGIRKSVNSPFSARGPRSRGNSLAGINSDLLQTLAQNPFE